MIYYTNKSGNDVNPGTSRALAKRTIQGAVDAAGASGDTVKVGCGVYAEAVQILSKTMVLEADTDYANASGFVVIDGETSRPYGIYLYSTSAAMVIRGIAIRNAVAGIRGDVNIDPLVERCHIEECGTGIYWSAATGWFGGRVRRCSILNCGTGIVWATFTSSPTLYLTNSTIVGCMVGVQPGFSPLGAVYRDNIFLNCGRDFDFSAYGANTDFTADYNDHFGWTMDLGRFNGTNYTTLATWQAGTGKDTNSINSNPQCLDAPRGMLLTAPTSPVRRRGSNGCTIGIGIGEGITSTRNPLLWTGGVFTNTVINTLNQVVLTGPVDSGVYETDVLDLGSTGISADQVWDHAAISYPAEVIDSSIADSAPNRHTIEYRASQTTFLKTDGSPAYSPVERRAIFGPVMARYWQFRYTLRSNGVSA